MAPVDGVAVNDGVAGGVNATLNAFDVHDDTTVPVSVICTYTTYVVVLVSTVPTVTLVAADETSPLSQTPAVDPGLNVVESVCALV